MKYKYHPVWPMGDNADEQYKELLELLDKGWLIVSDAADRNKVNYILCKGGGKPNIHWILRNSKLRIET